jgi:hypothetical protein
MGNHVTIASAGNTLAAAHAALQALGFELSLVEGTDLIKAKGAQGVFVAADPVLLLGLVRLHELRGEAWQPTDSEVEDFLAFVQSGDA